MCARARNLACGDHAEDGGLSGSIGADQVDDSSTLDKRRDVAERRHATKALGLSIARAADDLNDLIDQDQGLLRIRLFH